MHIHPLIFALFFPKIIAAEERMLRANFGRLCAQRAQAFLKSSVAYERYITEDATADNILAADISKDPNSLAYFSDDKPIENLLKRFKIQIKLWENVESLRRGRLFSQSKFDEVDAISGFITELNSYEWTYFDSPDMFQVQDEGSILKKLLAVFSWRPIFSIIQTVPPTMGGRAEGGMIDQASAVFMYTPLINVNLHANFYNIESSVKKVTDLESTFTYSNWYMEHKMWVPKVFKVIDCTDVLFFNINRKSHTPALEQSGANIGLNYVNVSPFAGIKTIMKQAIQAYDPLPLAGKLFRRRSAVCAKVIELSTSGTSYNEQIGTIALVSADDGTLFVYDPLAVTEQASNNMAVYTIPGSGTDDEPGYEELLSTLGTIIVYTKME